VEGSQQPGMGMGPQHMRGRMRKGPPHMGAGHWLSALVFGAVVGGALGLLFAPRRGRETREVLSEALQQGRGVSGEFRAKVAKALSSGRVSPTDLISQTQRQLDDLRSQAVRRLSDAKLRGQILRKEAELRYLKGKERLQREV